MMYDKLPYMVYGFHGCDQTIKDEILKKGSFFKTSSNAYDWLGKGIYFGKTIIKEQWNLLLMLRNIPNNQKGQ